MSFKFNSDREQIRAISPSLIGDNELTIRGGVGSNEREILRTLLDPGTSLPRVGINRTGQRIDTISVTNPGGGYTDIPTVTVAPPPAGGLQAFASAQISEGRLVGVVIDNPGAGYTDAPAVSVSGGNGVGAAATAFLDTVDFELDINGAIRTSTSIISDTARILNLDIENLVTPDAQYRAPNLKTFINNTGIPWARDTFIQKNTFVYRGPNVYQSLNEGTTDANPLNPPIHTDGIVLNGNDLEDAVPGVQFKHIGFRVSNPNEVYYNETGEAGIYPRSITPLLGDKSDKIATTEYVLNLATNDVGGRIYVSQQIGNDENDGRSAVNPVRTIKRACQLAWATPGVKESIIVSGGDYVEDNPISIPPDASVVGDNLRLVIIRPNNPRKHIFKFGDKNYVIGVTYRDYVDSDGDEQHTWDFAMVFDDKQRVTYDYDVNGDFGTSFPIGHQVFGEQIFRATFQSNAGLQNLTANQTLRGENAGGLISSRNVNFDLTSGPSAYLTGTFDFVVTNGSISTGETLFFAGGGTERFQINTAYDLNDLVWTEDHLYQVTVAGTSGTTNPTHDVGAVTNGTAEFTYLRDTYSLVTTDIISIRAEGEVVFEDTDIVSLLPISRIDFSQQGTDAVATGGFGDYGTPEDLGGIIFYTNPLVEDDNIHDYKEGQMIEITGMPTSAPDLSALNGKQRIYKVIEDPDGRSRRFVIPKKYPSLTNDNFTGFSLDASVKSYAKSATFSLLNSPFKFNEATPVARRFQDAGLQIKNNREFIADEVVGRINDEFKKDYFAVYDIGGTPSNTLTPSNVTYDPATGVATFTVSSHGLSNGDGVRIIDESITFTCAMDGNKTEHSYPDSHHYSSGKSLPVENATANTFEINVGVSGPDQQFTPITASYNPATGDLVLDLDTAHGLSVGEGIVIDDNSLSFTCSMDNYDSVKTYPRPGIDPYAGRSIPITAVPSDTEITLNVGVSGPNKTFTPTDATYDPVTGDMTVTVGQHGLGVGRGIVIENNSFTFTCATDGNVEEKTYPRSGQDPYADGKSIPITAVGSTSHTVTDATYNPVTGVVELTIPSHGFTQGDYIKLDDLSLVFSCELDGNVTNKSYPRAGYDYPSGRWLEISEVAANTFRIDIGPSSYTGAHTFVSAVANGLDRQDGTFTVNVGAISSPSDQSAHTFVSAQTNAIRHNPQSAHTFQGATSNAIKHLPQSAHTFIRSAQNSLVVGGSEFKIYLGTSRFIHEYVSGGTVTFGGTTANITNFVYDNIITGTAVVSMDQSLGALAEDDIVQIADITLRCVVDGVTTEKTYPSFNIPVSDDKCRRDIRHFLNALVEDLEFGSNNNIVSAARRYVDGTNTQIDFVDNEIIQTVRAIEYARELATFAMSKWRTGNRTPTDPVYTPQYSTLPRYFDDTIIDDGQSPACANVAAAIDTLSYLFVDVLANDSSGTVLDAAYLIARNRHHIADEAYNLAIVNYPSLGLINIDERKCRRDINFILSGWIRDLVLGGNSGTVTNAEAYFNGGQLAGIPQSELGATLFAFEKTRDLAIAAMRGWKTAAGTAYPAATYTPIPRFTDATILADPNGNPLCADVEASITTLHALLEDILDSTIAPGATEKNTGTLFDIAGIINYADSVITDARGNVITVKGTYDDFPIIEASPYTQNSSIISRLGGSGALIDGSKVKQPNCPRAGLTQQGEAKFPNQGKSMVASAFTIVSEGGIGYKIIEDGYTQLVSVFCIFCEDGVLSETGGYASITNSATNFGIYALRATGFRREAYEFDVATITNVSSTPTGRTIFSVSGLGREPLEHYVVKIDGYENANPDIEYFVDVVEGVTVGPPFSAQITLESGSGGSAEFRDLSNNAIVSLASLVGETVRLHRPSIVNSSSHTWEYAGSGTSYLALPENGGVKTEANEQVSENYGRTYVSGTDELGDFKVGTFARIENRTGNITFTGTVTISEVEFLKLKGGDVVVTGFDNSNTLGGANTSDSKLPTQKAVKDFITNNLGPFINKPYSTNPVPRALVELTDSGKISEDQIPPLRPFQVYTVGPGERTSVEGALAGDIAIEQSTPPQSFILNNDNDSLFLGFPVDSTLSFTIGDIFTGDLSGGKIQATEYRTGVLYQINLTDSGSGYITPPVVTIAGTTQSGGVQASATTQIANGQVVLIEIVDFNGFIGGKGYTSPPTITIAAPAGSGTQATAVGLIESRLYGDIVNNIKITETDDILSSDLPAETVNITRVVNTSGSNSLNWISLSSDSISANQITSGIISTARLASNASGETSAANSFTFLRGDQAYAPAVQTLKGPETRYFGILKTTASTNASQLVFEGSTQFGLGHEVRNNVVGIQADTNIDGILTENGETTVSIDKFLTATLPAGTVIEFDRGRSPLSFESSQTQGEFVEAIVIQNGGSNYDNGPFFNVSIGGGNGTGLRANIFTTNGSVTGVTIVSGGEGYGQNTDLQSVDFICDIPSELGNTGTGLVLLAKVTTVLRQYANVSIDIDRVTNQTLNEDAFGTLGVARFKKSQFVIGQSGNGSVEINTGPDSGLDADTLDGAQGAFYLNAGNLNAGFLKIERLSGTYNIGISGRSGSTIKLITSTNSPTGNLAPNEFSEGVICDTKNNTADGLFDGGTRHMVMTFRAGGSDFDATFGGVRQLAITDGTPLNGGNLWLRGSHTSPANAFGGWNLIWHSENDGVGSGLDADRLDSRQGSWYQNAVNINEGILANNRIPVHQTARDFNEKIRIVDWTGTPRYQILIRDELLGGSAPFLPGQTVNLYDAGDNGVGSISIAKVTPYQDINDASNNFTIIVGSLTTGDFVDANGNTIAKFIGTGGVANAYEFQDWSISNLDDNADGDVDGTFEVIDMISDGGNARLKLGRIDGQQSSDPSIYFRSSQSPATNYNSAFIATGGNAGDGSGSLELKVANEYAFTINGNYFWNQANIEFHTANILPTTDQQGAITVRSGVMRDVNGDFEARIITADLTGAASENVLKAGDTMSGSLTIGGVTAANQALEVSGRADFLSNITVATDLTVNSTTFHVDATDDAVGFGTSTPETGVPIHVYKNTGNETIPTLLRLETLRGDFTTVPGGSQIMFKNQDSNNGVNEAFIRAVTVNATTYGDNDEANTNFIFRQTNNGTARDNMIITGDGRVGINIMNPTEKLHVEGNAYVSQSITSIQGLTLGTTANNDEAPIFFLGNTGGLVGGGPDQLSNFRMGNGIISGDIFEITANDGSVGATSWKATPALAIQGTNNRVAINTDSFQGNDPEDNTLRTYTLNIEGDVNFNGTLFQNNGEFVTSRWTEAPNEADIYRPSFVGINFQTDRNPEEALEVEGNIEVSGNLQINGDVQWLDTYGVVRTTRQSINEDITVPNSTNALSHGIVNINNTRTVTVGAGAIWTIV
jgi:hypothetical protein